MLVTSNKLINTIVRHAASVITDFFNANLPIINEDAVPNVDTFSYDDDGKDFLYYGPENIGEMKH